MSSGTYAPNSFFFRSFHLYIIIIIIIICILFHKMVSR